MRERIEDFWTGRSGYSYWLRLRRFTHFLVFRNIKMYRLI